MTFWFEQLTEHAGSKYPEQISFLRENYGFSQTHANAVVMYSRGSTSTQRVASLDSYLAEFDTAKQAKAREIFTVILTRYPKAQVVIAWNKPMVKLNDEYLFGLTIHQNHILLAPWGNHMIDLFRDQLSDYEVNKKTFKVPDTWVVDKKLLLKMVATRIEQLKSGR